ncbi:uncharacterized protein LOC143940612 isoform X2 [Lithobates pipiens]
MEDVESMLAKIRSAALVNGTQWLRAQLSGLLPGLEPVTGTPAPELAHAGRSRPPGRSSPEPPPRGCRRPGSPILDPSASTAKRKPALWSGGAGRNPLQGRPPGEERGSLPSSQTPSVDQRDHAAYTAGVLPAAGVAWRGGANSTGADQMSGTAGSASGSSCGTTGGGAGVATPELDRLATSTRQTAQRGRRAVASDFFSQQPWEVDRTEGELTTSKEEGAVDTKDYFSRLPWEKDRSEGELTTLEEGAVDASDDFSQMPGQQSCGLPSEEDESEGEQAASAEAEVDTKDFFSQLPWEKDSSEGERAPSKAGTVDAEDNPLPGSNTGLQGSTSAAVLSSVARQPATSAGKPKGFCWLFNKDTCRFGETCRFRHECSGCEGSHPLAKCSKKGKEQARERTPLKVEKLAPFPTTSAGKPKGFCWLFNKDTCRFGETCCFRHECSGCEGSHPLAKCSKKGKEQARERTPLKVEKLAPFPSSERLVWILGHSHVLFGAEQAAVKPEGKQLGFPREQVRVRWIGIPGMLWSRVLREVQHYSRLDRPPDVLLLHVGGDDLGIRTSLDLSRDIKFDFQCLRSMFPNTIFVWSEMVARTSWNLAMSVERLNKARIKVNKEVGKFFVRNGGLTIRHRDLEKEPQLFLKEDGVHLNTVGIDIWSLGLQEGIQRALRMWRAAQS